MFIRTTSGSVAVFITAAVMAMLTGSMINAPVARAESELPAAVAGDVGGPSQDLAGPYWTAQQPTITTRTDPWPSQAAVVSRLRAYGLDPILEPGYDDPVYEANANLTGQNTPMAAFMLHDTGTNVPANQLLQAHSLPWILTGNKSSAGKTVRAGHFYVDRLGLVYVVYLGRTWHAGVGDSMFGVPADRMNGYSMGVEIESHGGGVQDLTPAQILAASKVAAAALDVAGLGTERAINHKDYAGRKQGKVDTAYDIGWWRAQIAAVRSGGVPALAPGGLGSPPTVAVVSADPKAVSLAAAKPGAAGAYVARYQRALRAYARKLGIRVKTYNPSGITGNFGSETRLLTRVTFKALAVRSRAWRVLWNTTPRNVPNPQLLRKIGLHVIP
ncbi:MAG: N-acetylmuramoyl-L-alanine amidase [Actinomycetes bacterium]